MTEGELDQVDEQLRDALERLKNTARFLEDDDMDWDDELDVIEHAQDLTAHAIRHVNYKMGRMP